MEEKEETDALERLARMVILTPDQIMAEGLNVAGFELVRQRRSGKITNIARFKAFYGCSPDETAIIWEELQITSDEEARIDVKSEGDLHFLLMTLHFLFVYPTKHRAEGLFDVAINTFYKWTWLYIGKLAALSTAKIVWPEEWKAENLVNVPKYLLSVDGVHCRKFEPAHPTLPKNKKVLFLVD
jgi:hypothetical protein